jgi:uncharacterized protein
VSITRHLIVDGANILHAWPELRRLAQHDRAGARTKLGQLLTSIHDSGEVRLTLVFDGRGEDIVVERPFSQPTFSVVYTPSSLTADDVIEQLVANSADPSECLVATDDNAERETVAALGATTLKSEDLAEWVKRAETRQTAIAQNLRAANTRAWKKS